MLKIGFKPKFLRQFKKFSPKLKTEIREQIEILKNDPDD
jgi:mRNA-degrading endonuclease RelE of RelBE toxin-antitoxin system